MKFRRIACAAAVFLFCVTLFSYIEPVAAEEYDFSERIVYGGNALDVGDYIYFANTEDGMNLYRRIAGSEEAELIYPAQASYLNLLNERLYFISNNRIVSTDLAGRDERIMYSALSNITHLYAAPDCMYFLSGNEIKKHKNNSVKTVLKVEGLRAFLPVNEHEFIFYTDNPDYCYIDQSGDEIYHETGDKYIKCVYEAKTAEIIVYAEQEVVTASSSAGYPGPFVEVGEVVLPLEEYMPGSFFTKNGKACTCHNIPIPRYCIESVGDCNCMRYWPTGIAETCEVDLLGAQCFAFARFVFYRCFGFIDHSLINPGKFYNAGSLGSGRVTANAVKELFMNAAPGAHVRLSRGHSVSILSMDNDFLYIYHGNAGGDGVLSQPCVVSTRLYTWAEFALYASAGIEYVNMPYDYPGDINITPKIYLEGYYKVAYVENALNVRSGPGTSYSILGTLGKNESVIVHEVSGGWGRIDYNDNKGWISLDYTAFFTLSALTPAETSSAYIDDENQLVIGVPERCSWIELTENFPNQLVYAYDISGNRLPETDYIGTGAEIRIEVEEKILDSKTVLIKGDCNGNGVVDIGDYLIVKRIFLGSYLGDDIQQRAADINGDMVIDSKDYLAIKRYFVGIDEKL